MKADSLQTSKHSKPLYILMGLIHFVSLSEYGLDTRLVTTTWKFSLKSFKGLVHLTSIFHPQALYPVAQIKH